MLKKVLKTALHLLLIVVSTVFLFELSFRYQLIDFYKNELVALNPKLEKSSKSILLFGDSFTAHIDSYVSFLRQSNPTINFVNAALPGSGVKQHELFAKTRIKEYQPQQIIYQFYVGNDFLDIEHHPNIHTISIPRNIYWLIADRLLGIHYLNFRLAFLRSNGSAKKNLEMAFSTALYNPRVKTLFAADPTYLENSINLEGAEEELYQIWKEKFKRIVDHTDSDIPFSIVVIPHCAQLNQSYQKRMESIGALFNANIQTANYPLIKRLKKDFPKIKIINPLGRFQEEYDKASPLYYENDPHLTLKGQELLANIIQDELNLSSIVIP